MNQTHLNSELLSGEARTRKNVPVAVFAVIFIHIVLFVLLLVAAGCRARAKAAKEAQPDTGVAREMVEPTESQPARPEPVDEPASEMLYATEPALEEEASPEMAVNLRTVEESVGAEASEPAGTEADGAVYHTVKAGDSLWQIARKYGTTVKALKAINNLKDDSLKLGQKLRVDFSTPLRAQKT